MSNHYACPCGCDELADECAGPTPNPFGSIRVLSELGTTRARETALPQPSSKDHSPQTGVIL